MSITDLPRDPEAMTDLLIERTKRLVPAIRARSRRAEELRRLPDETMAEVEAAGLLQTLVPKRWGGHGLGLRALCEIPRILAHGDASTAWTVSFLMEHNWMACHLDMRAQSGLYAERPYIRAAATLFPAGAARRVEGGFVVSGKWRYASGIHNAEWVFVTSPVEENGEPIPYSFLLPRASVTVHDDWFMTGMAATGSSSVSGEGIFVPDARGIETEIFHSANQHPGAGHAEPIYRYPMLNPLFVMVVGISLGCAQAVVELGRVRLAESALFGLRRLDRDQSRTRWSTARQDVRGAELLWYDLLHRTIAKCDAEEPWSLEEEGQLALDVITIAHRSKDAIRSILDGVGSSGYQLDNPLPRHMRDVDVMVSWPGQDWDIVAERASRWVLGLGRSPNDPFPPRTTPRGGRA